MDKQIYIITESQAKKLKEARFEDVSPKGYMEFYEKYSKIPVKDRSDLYVQFTDHQPDTLQRSPYMNPDHSDPAGVYGYPLDYVLKYPSDVWYGSDAKFLRVLKDTSKNKLTLNYYNSPQDVQLVAKELYKGRINRYTLQDIYNKVDFADRVISGRNRWAKLLFFLIQHNHYNDYELRSPKEQNKIVQKMGFDAIEDVSKSDSTAIVNPREPEQIIFLNRYAFEVVETFKLSDKSEGVSTKKDEEIYNDRLANIIFNVLGDSPASRHKNKLFWSKEGKRLEIEWTFPNEYMETRNIGQKLHRERKKSSWMYPIIRLYTQYGRIAMEGKPEESMKEIAMDVKSEYEKLIQNPEPYILWNGKPYTGQTKKEYFESMAGLEKKQQQERAKESREKKKKEAKELSEKIFEITFIYHELDPNRVPNPHKHINLETAPIYLQYMDFQYTMPFKPNSSYATDRLKMVDYSVEKIYAHWGGKLSLDKVRGFVESMVREIIDYYTVVYNYMQIADKIYGEQYGKILPPDSIMKFINFKWFAENIENGKYDTEVLRETYNKIENKS